MAILKLGLERNDTEVTFAGGADNHDRVTLRLDIDPTTHTSPYTKIFVWGRRRITRNNDEYTKTYFVRVATVGDLHPVTGIPEDEPAAGVYPMLFRRDYVEMVFYGSDPPAADARDDAYDQIVIDMENLAAALDDVGVTAASVTSFDYTYIATSSSSMSSSSVGAVPAAPAPLLSSSSSFAGVPATPPVVHGSSSSSIIAAQSSSSSYVTPLSELITYEVAPVSSRDSAFILHSTGGSESDTLYNNLPFVRIGRNNTRATSLQTGVDVIVNETYTTLLRFPITLDRCVKLDGVALVTLGLTTETVTDCVVTIKAIYSDGNLTPINSFTTIPDYTTQGEVIWAPVDVAEATGTVFVSPDLTGLLTRFLRRTSYVPGQYFGLAIEEVLSDPGARRDFDVSKTKLAVTYYREGTGVQCASSSSSSFAG
jgi:hypothetical protein